MMYTLSIDWLSFFCLNKKCHDGGFEILKDLPQNPYYDYVKQPYGTRQFAHLYFVYMNKEKIAEVQSKPHSDILAAGSVIVKFDNAVLYNGLWQTIITDFLRMHYLEVQRISRIDLAADFQRFETYEVVPFIRDFMAMELRHIGRGDGAAYFEHRAKNDPKTKCSIYAMQYSGLSFGSHSSDVRVYLYNKTKELAEQGDKPYIRDLWTALGFGDYSTQWLTDIMKHGMPSMWRLEVSIKGDAIRFKDKASGQDVEIALPDIFDSEFVRKVYFTMIHSYFEFVRNRPGIRNITREPRIDLWGHDEPIYTRRVPRKVTGGNMSERIAIHKLWQLNEEIRAMDNTIDQTRAQSLAVDLAAATDLSKWLQEKYPTWEPKKYKR